MLIILMKPPCGEGNKEDMKSPSEDKSRENQVGTCAHCSVLNYQTTVSTLSKQ